jgi:hypothetical protein
MQVFEIGRQLVDGGLGKHDARPDHMALDLGSKIDG